MADTMIHLAGRQYVIHLYRGMLKSARKLQPPKRRDDAVRSVKEGFRLNAGVEDNERRIELLREAESKLGYLHIVTPKKRVGGAGSTTAVFRDGKVLDGAEARKRERARHTNWDGKNMDPDCVTKHKHNLARAGFQDHTQVIGPHGF